MTELHTIIAVLEQRRVGAALIALRGVATQADRSTPSTHQGTSEGRRRQIEAMRRYRASRKATKTAESSTTIKKTRARRGITPEGRKRLSEMMRKRWAAKRRAGK